MSKCLHALQRRNEQARARRIAEFDRFTEQYEAQRKQAAADDALWEANLAEIRAATAMAFSPWFLPTLHIPRRRSQS